MELYHGCQNRFAITEEKHYIEHPQEAIQICLEYEVDGLIVFIKNPLKMVLLNADGSVASMCGNGIQCFVKYGVDQHYITQDHFTVKTLAGEKQIEILSKNPFVARVNLGVPSFSAKKMGIDIEEEELFGQEVKLLGKNYSLYAVWTGTDHVVIPVSDFKAIDAIGPLLGRNKLFKGGINVNFMRVVDKHHIEVRTFERGVGWTKACGTGSSASVVVANRLGLVEDNVNVTLLGGDLTIELIDKNVFMTGPAVKMD
ncbi:MAG: diaminopimelate epimerase [Bacilli bacterium]|nr:diaminopimelate epimerase [Bacilli bacterium]